VTFAVFRVFRGPIACVFDRYLKLVTHHHNFGENPLAFSPIFGWINYLRLALSWQALFAKMILDDCLLSWMSYPV
jgi:hypothetical protein